MTNARPRNEQETTMTKKVLFAAAASAILAGALMTAPITADAAVTCKDAAKMKYPDSLLERMQYRHDCKKAWKDATGSGLLNKLKS
jgi:hypothetical protein